MFFLVGNWLKSLQLLQIVGVEQLCVQTYHTVFCICADVSHCVLWNSLMHGYSCYAHLWIYRNDTKDSAFS